MFTNIGNKIKKLAKIVCWVGIILSILASISMFIAAASGQVDPITAVTTGIVAVVVGVLVSWIGCFLLYGFGELVDNSTKMREMMEKKP